MAEIKLAELGVAKKVATPVPKPDTPVLMGRPVQFVNVPELGVPNTGVVNVGLVNVLFVNVCVPVRFTRVSVPAGIVTVPVAVEEVTMVVVPEPEPAIVNPALPMAGLVKLGLLENTKVALPVSSVKAAARLALEGVAKNVATLAPKPDTPVEMGNPVQLVNVPLAGVPRTGAVKVLLLSVCVVSVPTNVVLASGTVNVLVVAVVMPSFYYYQFHQ
jgi:hypothetical protein